MKWVETEKREELVSRSWKKSSTVILQVNHGSGLKNPLYRYLKSKDNFTGREGAQESAEFFTKALIFSVIGKNSTIESKPKNLDIQAGHFWAGCCVSTVEFMCIGQLHSFSF
jgi:hypothetical protein